MKIKLSKTRFLTLAIILSLSLAGCSDPSSSRSSEKALTSFGFTSEANAALDSDVSVIMDGTNITATVPYGTDVTALVATFTTTGSSVSVGGATQTSGFTANNFSDDVTYCVTAEDGSSANYRITVSIAGTFKGSIRSYSIGSATLNMQYCPGGTFPTGIDDSGSEIISDAFWIGETEVTYELWYTVYTWAVDNGYSFANTGIPGNDGTAGTDTDSQEPVTTINWRDAVLFCNALTEYYNAHNSDSFTCVYTSDSGYATPIRTATNSTAITWEEGTGDNDGSQDDPYVNPDGTGFRLPAMYEWECAARYIDGSSWTPGSYASGAAADFDDAAVLGNVAVYDSNSGSSTAAVKSKAANALGCYDMSGNVHEWNFDWETVYSDQGTNRLLLGGSWCDSSSIMQIGNIFANIPSIAITPAGLRLYRNAD